MITVAPGDTGQRALEQMKEHWMRAVLVLEGEALAGIVTQGHCASRNYRHLPVVDNGKVVGVVSIGDRVKNILRQMGDQVIYLETYIRGHGGQMAVRHRDARRAFPRNSRVLPHGIKFVQAPSGARRTLA